MPVRGYQPQWHGPHLTRVVALATAHAVADRTQRAVAVWDALSQGFFLLYETDGQPAHAPFSAVVDIVRPDPKAAPTRTWPVLHMLVTSDRVARDVQADAWRRQSDLGAKAALGKTNGQKPYAVSAKETRKRVNGFMIPLYTLTVRQNPNFPHDKLAVPLTPTRANTYDR